VGTSEVDALRQQVRELEAALRTARSAATDLADANGELERFTAIVAHDLRGPMAVIAGMASLLATRVDDLEPAVAQEFLERIEARAVQAAALVEDLLGYARDGGHGDRRPVDLGDLADAAFADLAEEAEAAGATLSRGPLPAVFGSPTALRQVLVNLVANSIRYRHPDRPPVIHVDATERGSRWVIRVTDNGIGIPTDLRERVFQLGVHTDTDADGRRGTGVGLASCRLVVTRLGGRIWVEPHEDGRGTTVAFELASVRSHPAGERPRTVVLVDDDADGQAAMAEALHAADVALVGTAETAAEAVALLASLDEEPGAVLVDLRLGSDDGIELVARLHDAHPTVPFVLHSAHIDGTTTARAADAGAAGCIEKTTPDQLVDAVMALWLGPRSPRRSARLRDAATELPPVTVFTDPG
jgi:CheY-like chemotaxis protein/two-component sensor histidine kinase